MLSAWQFLLQVADMLPLIFQYLSEPPFPWDMLFVFAIVLFFKPKIQCVIILIELLKENSLREYTN